MSETFLSKHKFDILKLHPSLCIALHPNQSMSPCIPHRNNINLREAPIVISSIPLKTISVNYNNDQA